MTSACAHVIVRAACGAPGVPAGFTTRVGGVSAPPFDSLNFGNPSELPPGVARDPAANIAENFRRALGAVGASERRMVQVHQVHAGDVLVIRAGDGPRSPDPKGDAIVTDDPRVVAVVRVADCAPVLLWSGDGRVVAAVHAGWRGVIAGIATNAVRAMRSIGTDTIHGAIGPCIGPAAFEVGPEVLDRFRAAFGPDAPIRITDAPPGKGFIDLKESLRRQLNVAGVRDVEISRECTFSDARLFFSHRRDRGVTGRMIGFIGPRSR